MYNHALHRRTKHFCRYCLQAFSTEVILKRHIKGCFKINGKQKIIMTVSSYHVTYAFQSESTLYSCLNVKELLARSRREI